MLHQVYLNSFVIKREKQRSAGPDFSWLTEMDFILLLTNIKNSFTYKNDILYVQQIW